MEESNFNRGKKSLQKLYELHLGKKRELNKLANGGNRIRRDSATVDIVEHELKVGDVFKVKLKGMTSDGLFAVKSMREKVRYGDMMSKLKQHYGFDRGSSKSSLAGDGLGRWNPEACSENDLVCCEIGVGNFIRARILKADLVLHIFVVLDIDAYDSHVVESRHVLPLPADFRCLPPKTFHCVIEGVNSRNFTFRAAIHSTLSRLHENVVLEVCRLDCSWGGNKLLPIVKLRLPNGKNVADLLVASVFRNVEDLPLVVASRSSDCHREVALLPYLSSSLQFSSGGPIYSDGQQESYHRNVTHVCIESFFRAENGQQKILLDEIHRVIAEKSNSQVRWKDAGFRHWYCCLYVYNHLYDIRANPRDHEGKYFIEFPTGLGPVNPLEFKKAHGLLGVKPESLLGLIPNLDVSCNLKNFASFYQNRNFSSKVSQERLESNIQPVSTNWRSKALGYRRQGFPKPFQPANAQNLQHLKKNRNQIKINHELIAKDTQFAESIASKVKFPPERKPVVKQQLDDISLTEEITPYLFFMGDADLIDLSIFEEPADTLSVDDWRVSSESPKTYVKEHEAIGRREAANTLRQEFEDLTSSTMPATIYKANCPQPLLPIGESFSAKLCGSDHLGFVYIHKCDETLEEDYVKLHQEIQDLYGKEAIQEMLQLLPSDIRLGDVAITKVGHYFLRCRVFQHHTSKHACIVSDLENHDFHTVPTQDLYKPLNQFLRLPPKAIACVLNGLTFDLFTDGIPYAIGELALTDSQVLVTVMSLLNTKVPLPVVSMSTVDGKDLSQLVKASYSSDRLPKHLQDDLENYKPVLKIYLSPIE